jgi:hypothetical protein
MDDFDDRFEPLTESERAAAQAGDDTPKDEGVCIMPVPANAPPMPSEHPKLGTPSGRWPYPDADGALLFEVWRLDPDGERKQFLPLSLWRDALGALRWRWKAVPGPRPLYGLGWLAAMPGASVVVCEGEKAADAAALTFPKSVCITSAGGCKAAAKADWTPLAGRKVLIWPDNDEPGSKYAITVASTVRKLGCDVSIIDAAALASIAPDGSQRDPVNGWDAADAAEEWQHLAALRKAAHGLTKPFAPGLDVAGVAIVREPPRPLRRQPSPAEPFPTTALGDVLGGAVRAIIDKVQCPDAIAAASVLAAASLAVQAHADVALPATGRAGLYRYTSRPSRRAASARVRPTTRRFGLFASARRIYGRLMRPRCQIISAPCGHMTSPFRGQRKPKAGGRK